MTIFHLAFRNTSDQSRKIPVCTLRQTPEGSEQKYDSEHKCRLWKSELNMAMRMAKQRQTKYEPPGQVKKQERIKQTT
jgi:hypothetical protein